MQVNEFHVPIKLVRHYFTLKIFSQSAIIYMIHQEY